MASALADELQERLNNQGSSAKMVVQHKLCVLFAFPVQTIMITFKYWFIASQVAYSQIFSLLWDFIQNLFR